MQVSIYIVNRRRNLGVREEYLFKTIDLFEEQDMSAVVECLYQLKLVVEKKSPPQTQKDSRNHSHVPQNQPKRRNWLWISLSQLIIGPFLAGIAAGIGLKFGRGIFVNFLRSSPQSILPSS
jgi:hypothetical protein